MISYSNKSLFNIITFNKDIKISYEDFIIVKRKTINKKNINFQEFVLLIFTCYYFYFEKEYLSSTDLKKDIKNLSKKHKIKLYSRIDFLKNKPIRYYPINNNKKIVIDPLFQNGDITFAKTGINILATTGSLLAGDNLDTTSKYSGFKKYILKKAVQLYLKT